MGALRCDICLKLLDARLIYPFAGKDYCKSCLELEKATRPEEEKMSGPTKLSDQGEWINRFKIKSETSDAEYTVAQNKYTLLWGCSCKGWTTKRAVNGVKPNCKHLKAIIPIAEQLAPKRGNTSSWQQAVKDALGGGSGGGYSLPESSPMVIKEKGKRRFNLDD